MTEIQRLSLTLTQESDYVFRIAFDDSEIPELITDESAPLGGDRGPNPSRLLLAAVANCLSASLLFSLRKFRNTPGTLVTHAEAELSRNAEGRLRVGQMTVTLELPEAAGEYHQIERLLQQFEQFCVVTESVRAGIPVAVRVRDTQGALLHQSAPA
ncbi:OsmC family protein [Dyella sp.]|uniref:OsmC family protein n=1 Tax=Dyella sp. TaxID=1869338 RepID=UPI002D780667|nr:OsmC family protein [Dyella sp.]HET6433069.1 OsmC family protein [Dyella sp.]